MRITVRMHNAGCLVGRGEGNFWEQTPSFSVFHSNPFLLQVSAHLLLPLRRSTSFTDFTCFSFMLSLSRWLLHSRYCPNSKSFYRVEDSRWTIAADVWWVDLGWLPAAHQAALITPPPSAGRGGKNMMRRSHESRWGQGDHFTFYHHRQNRLNLRKWFYWQLIVAE